MEKLQKARQLGFVVLSVAAVIVTFAVGNAGKSPTATNDAVRLALVEWDLNESTADSAPQQSVTAQWAAKDLLAAIGRAEARQSSAVGTKIPVLLLLAVLALCWNGITSEPIPTRREADDVEGESMAGSLPA
ncbi:MAG: hypothetical protein WD598_00910 [Acidimicrobiia bacterium]